MESRKAIWSAIIAVAIAVVAIVVYLAVLQEREPDGRAEQIGEKIDEAVEETGDAIERATDQ